MILYHGSYIVIDKPDLIHSRDNVDFGRGFYTTPIYEQARSWAMKFARRGQECVINRYQFDEVKCTDLNILRFDTYSEDWLDFVLCCRSGKDRSDFDIVSGGVANDKVFNTVELYFEELIDKAEAIKRLRYEKPNLQIVFRSEAALACLHFEGSEIL